MNIDPHNLGPCVFKSDQVITQQDILAILEELNQIENCYVRTDDQKDKLILVRTTMEMLLDWLMSGKKYDITFGA